MELADDVTVVAMHRLRELGQARDELVVPDVAVAPGHVIPHDAADDHGRRSACCNAFVQTDCRASIGGTVIVPTKRRLARLHDAILEGYLWRDLQRRHKFFEATHELVLPMS